MFRLYFAESLRHSRVYTVNPAASAYFMGEQFGMTAVIALFAFAEGISLPDKFRIHPLFTRYQEMANVLAVVQNDLVGLERDLVNGELNNIIYQMKAGKGLYEVVAREMKLYE